MTKKITIKDIASKCGISPTVVSAILRGSKGTVSYSEKTRDKVQACAKTLGYSRNVFASSMVLGKSPIIALCLHCEHPCQESNFLNLYLYDKLTSAGFLLNDAGLKMLFSPFSNVNSHRQTIEELVNSGVVGGFITNIIPGYEKEIVDYVKMINQPYIIIGYDLDTSVHSAFIDHSPLITKIVDYSQQKGFETIFHVSEVNEKLRFTRMPFKTSSHYNESEIPPSDIDFSKGIFAAHGKSILTRLKQQFSISPNCLVLVEDQRLHDVEGEVDTFQVNEIPANRRLMTYCAQSLHDWLFNNHPPENLNAKFTIQNQDISFHPRKTSTHTERLSQCVTS